MSSHPWHFLLESPLGPLGARADAQGRVTHLQFMDRNRLTLDCLGELQPHPAFRFLQRQVDAFFQGTCRTFNVPMAPVATAFQRRVWDALAEIPYGGTLALDLLATRLGAEGPSVSQAVQENPLVLLIPGHRIVDAHGQPIDRTGRQAGLLLGLEQGERHLSPLLANA